MRQPGGVHPAHGAGHEDARRQAAGEVAQFVRRHAPARLRAGEPADLLALAAALDVVKIKILRVSRGDHGQRRRLDVVLLEKTFGQAGKSVDDPDRPAEVVLPVSAVPLILGRVGVVDDDFQPPPALLAVAC